MMAGARHPASSGPRCKTSLAGPAMAHFSALSPYADTRNFAALPLAQLKKSQ